MKHQLVAVLTVLNAGLLVAACSGSGSDGSASEVGKIDVFIVGTSCGATANALPNSGVVVGDFDCEDETSPVPQPIAPALVGSGSINYLSSSIAISSAVVEEESDSEILLVLHDGETRFSARSFSGVVNGESVEKYEQTWGIYNGSLSVALGLASASGVSFEVGTFEFSTNPDVVPIFGKNELTSGGIVYNSNGNGKIEIDEEESRVTGGTVTIVGEKPNWSISIDVIFENGQSMVGQYSGDYFVLPRF